MLEFIAIYLIFGMIAAMIFDYLLQSNGYGSPDNAFVVVGLIILWLPTSLYCIWTVVKNHYSSKS